MVRLLISAVLSGVVGWEREQQRRSAGLRTHMLVGTGATLFIALVGVAIETFPQESGIHFDPSRVIQGVIIGIGFLGAGIIFVDPSAHRIRGLTTAASIWITTGIGLTVGLGRYVLAALATALIFVVLHTMREIEPNPKRHSD
jgi:putative Mg2+ transporter-C (MgtC) family protein